MCCKPRLLVGVAFALLGYSLPAALPALDEALQSREDLWGLAAMRETNGPSYDFFARLLPPLRYVNADFRFYPITLSAPNAPVKARFVSNGSAINARAVLNTWQESGTPVTFSVSDFPGWKVDGYGANLSRLSGPRYENGYLPIVQNSYEHVGTVFGQECFASVEKPLSDCGVVFVRFGVKEGEGGTVYAHFERKAEVKFSNRMVYDKSGNVVAWCSDNWKWDSVEDGLNVALAKGESAFLAVATKAVKPTDVASLTASIYKAQRRKCVETWERLLEQGTELETPEPIVNNAHRALLIQDYALVNGNEPRYSAHNAYDRLYQAECDDTAAAFMLWGFAADTPRMISEMMAYTRDKLEFHNAGFKLQTFARLYWLTRDKALVEKMRPEWNKEVDRIVNGRESESGLPPREKYCGDIETKVYSLHSSASAWRGLRDMAAVLNDFGDKENAARLSKTAADFRQKILSAADKSIFTNTQPPFVPIALFGEEKPHDPLTATMLGSYWNLIAPYVLGSEVLGPGSQRERWMLDYLQDKGGVFMGMIRFHQHSGLFANEDALDDLYGLRYVTTLLRLDEVDRALVSFYGKLAQGMTRDTFIGAEGTGLRPITANGLRVPAVAADEKPGVRSSKPSDDASIGRPMYLPPNSTANAHWLFALRYLLVQDWDLNDDGRPETLRLLFATPKAWLEDGKEIEIERAPTAFGDVSVHVRSRLHRGEVLAEVAPPKRNAPEKMLLRVRLPDGWKITSARLNKSSLAVDATGAVELPRTQDRLKIRFAVERQ